MDLFNIDESLVVMDLLALGFPPCGIDFPVSTQVFSRGHFGHFDAVSNRKPHVSPAVFGKKVEQGLRTRAKVEYDVSFQFSNPEAKALKAGQWRRGPTVHGDQVGPSGLLQETFCQNIRGQKKIGVLIEVYLRARRQA